MWYFAYGLNMVTTEMARLCPGASRVGLARLPGFAWRVAACGYASVVEGGPEDNVHGVLWELNEADFGALDAFEGVAEGLYVRGELSVEFDGRRLPAQVYWVPGFRPGRPRAGYIEAVKLAAREQGLVEEYVVGLGGASGATC